MLAYAGVVGLSFHGAIRTSRGRKTMKLWLIGFAALYIAAAPAVLTTNAAATDVPKDCVNDPNVTCSPHKEDYKKQHRHYKHHKTASSLPAASHASNRRPIICEDGQDCPSGYLCRQRPNLDLGICVWVGKRSIIGRRVPTPKCPPAQWYVCETYCDGPHGSCDDECACEDKDN